MAISNGKEGDNQGVTRIKVLAVSNKKPSNVWELYGVTECKLRVEATTNSDIESRDGKSSCDWRSCCDWRVIQRVHRAVSTVL